RRLLRREFEPIHPWGESWVRSLGQGEKLDVILPDFADADAPVRVARIEVRDQIAMCGGGIDRAPPSFADLFQQLIPGDPHASPRAAISVEGARARKVVGEDPSKHSSFS